MNIIVINNKNIDCDLKYEYIESLEQPNLIKIQISNVLYDNYINKIEYIPFSIKKTLINKEYSENMKELDCKIISHIIDYNVENVNIIINNINEYKIEFLTPLLNQIYIKNDEIKDFFNFNLKNEYKFISDNLCMYLINNNNIIKHKNLNIWYCHIDNYLETNIIIQSILKEYENEGIKGICIKNNKCNELIKAFEYEIIKSIDNYKFVKMISPFDYNWFVESLELINVGNIPEVTYKITENINKIEDIYKIIYGFMKIYVKILDVNLLDVNFIINNDIKQINYKIENIIKYNYIQKNIKNIKTIDLISFDNEEDEKNIRYNLSKNGIISMKYKKYIIWEKTNKITHKFLKQQSTFNLIYDIYDNLELKKIYPIDGIITKIEKNIKIEVFNNEYLLNSIYNIEDFKNKWNSGFFLSNWDKSYINTFNEMPFLIFN